MSKFLYYIAFYGIVSLVLFIITHFIYSFISNGLTLQQNSRLYLKYFLVISTLVCIFGDLSHEFNFDILLRIYGYFWLGVLSISFSVFLIAYLPTKFFPQKANVITIASIIASLLIVCYSTINEMIIPDVKTIKLEIENLPAELSGFSILQLSDLHLYKTSCTKRLKTIVDKTNAQKTDLIVITGDIMDDPMPENSAITKILGQLKARYGVWAVTGNHEFYIGVQHFNQLAKKANIKVLRNQKVTIKNSITLIGIDDETGFKFAKKESEWSNSRPTLQTLKKMMEGVETGKIVILLNHRPSHFETFASLGGHLQLSGHTHAGQIPPADLLTYMLVKYPYGLYRHKGAYLYTSCGLGSWGPHMRLFTKPEIVNFILERRGKNTGTGKK